MSDLSPKQLKDLEKIIQDFIDDNAVITSEANIQALYTIPLLIKLGWLTKHFKVNPQAEVKTGKVPDILLKNEKGETIFVIESKKGGESLDGMRGDVNYSQQLINYCEAEGVNWGMLTNFSEWRIYNTITKKLYYNRKYEIVKDDNKTVGDIKDLFSFLIFDNLKNNNGKIDLNPLYYQTPDDIKEDFFKKLKNWREDLRNHLYHQYKEKLTTTELDAQTQKILDRIIFISYCHKKRGSSLKDG